MYAFNRMTNSVGWLRLVEAVFTDDDKRNLQVVAEELPKLRSLVEELMETLEILSDETLMKSIRASEKDVQENRVLSFKDLLEDLSINEKDL
jgi:hypothetical protein